MRQKGRFRLNLVAFQLVAVLLVAMGTGAWMALAQDELALDSARAAVEQAHVDFTAEVQGSLAQGTPYDMLAELVIREALVHGRPQPAVAFPDSRRATVATQQTATGIRRITEDARLRELDVEARLQAQLAQALEAMQGDLVAARDAGVDTAEYDRFVMATVSGSAQMRIPKLGQLAIDQTQARDAQLRQATADRIAELAAEAAAAAALQAAHDNADYQRARANGDLTAALATGVLDVAAQAAAVADLNNRYAGAASVDDFDNFAAAYAEQARPIENLLYTRSSAYALLAQARGALARAQGAGADVAADTARLADLAGQLDRASNLGAIQAITGMLSIEIRDLNAAYQEARSRPFTPPGAIVANVPFTTQKYSLSCEEASLQMALAKYGVGANQDEILGFIGVDRRLPYFDAGGTLHWGNPYQTFVGNPNGYENATSGDQSGYGTYYTPIASAATHFGGHVQQAGEGISPAVIYNAAHNQQPAVVWVAYAYQPQPMRYMITFDNQTVMYGAPVEHAVTVAGWAPGYILLNNPHSHPEWIDAGTFERAYAMFNDMAVILQP